MEVKPRYKQTEVGVIPEEWEVSILQDACRETITYGIVQCGPHVKDGVPYIRVSDMDEPELDVDQMLRTSAVIASKFTRSRVDEGDLVYALRGKIGEVRQVRSYLAGANLTQGTARLSPSDRIASGYLVWAMRNPRAVRQAEVEAKGTTFREITLADLRRIKILVPSLSEQLSIAEALSDVDGLLGALGRLISKKRDLKQAAMQQLLTGQSRLPGFDGTWEDSQVQDVISSFFCGPSPTCEERNIQGDDEWGVLKTTAATKENGWDWTKHKALPRVFWNKPQLELKRGDVIVTKAGPRHRVGVAAWVDFVPSRIIVSGKMIGLRPRPDKVAPLMLAAAISARKAQVYMDQRTTGMAESQVNFENTTLLEAPIRIPSIEEQTAIADVLSDMDTELDALEQRREKTRALKQGMMQELLTGRTRLV